METPKASILQLNPDCQGTHYPQAEIEELEKMASSASLWQERFENAAQANARLEGQIEKMANLLHLCREGFFDIEDHSIDRSKLTLEFWMGYIHEIAYEMNEIISEAEEKHGLPIRPVAQTDEKATRRTKKLLPVVKK